MQRNWILPGKISQVGVGGVFGEDYLRIEASHTLEVTGAAVVEIDGHASGYPKWGHLQKEHQKRIRLQSVYSFMLPKFSPEANFARKNTRWAQTLHQQWPPFRRKKCCTRIFFIFWCIFWWSLGAYIFGSPQGYPKVYPQANVLQAGKQFWPLNL